VRQVAETLEVARSNLTEKLNKEIKPKDKKEINDDWILPKIKKIVEDRPTYGYRRVTALLCFELNSIGKTRVNHKRVYRIMKENDLLLARYDKKKTQTHDGTVITLKSNTRWCSDCFSIQCFNGDRIHVGFALDTCDREVMSYVASTIGIDGAAIRDLMVDSLEVRFGKINYLPHRVQWLSDNGPQYTSHETVNFARSIGFDVRTTPAYSPESNGMAEALVKTFKRDYVWFGNLKDAPTVMGQLAKWFEDYNENAPHKGLKMKSPRQFRRENEKILAG
jgi:transposase InsO family protein